MKPVEHFASFKDGKIQCQSFTAAVRDFAAKGCAVVLTIEEFKEKRSNTANAYYWAGVVDGIHRALKESGWEITKEGTHEMLRFRFLREDHPIG